MPLAPEIAGLPRHVSDEATTDDDPRETLVDAEADSEPTPSRPARERLLRAARYAAAVLAGACVLALVGSAVRTTAEIGPLDVRLGLVPALGGATEVAVPPLGEISAQTHAGPWRLDAEITGIRRSAAEEFVDDPAGELDRARSEVGSTGTSAVRRLALVVGVAGIALAFGVVAALTRRVHYGVAAAGGALVFAAASAVIGVTTWNPNAFREPTYEGLLSAAPQTIGSIEELERNFGEYRSALASGVERLGRLYLALTESDFSAEEVAESDVIRVLHVSDVHLNASAFDLADRLVRTMGVHAVVDTGDLTDYGTSVENSTVLAGIAGLGVPYLFVRGNHDSNATAAAVDALPNATVLDGMRVEVAGLSFWGIGDPAYSPDRESFSDRSDVVSAHEESAEDVAAKLREAGGADVVLVHSAEMATDIRGDEGEAPLVLAGDEHRVRREIQGGSLVLVTGTTGGHGWRQVRETGPVPMQAAVLGFDRTTRRLLYWDELTVAGGDGTSLAVDNVTIVRHRVTWEEQADGTWVPVLGGE